MEKRRLGRTEHKSTLVSFGGACFYKISQKEADRTMKLLIEKGINHIDVAPEYGEAEERIGLWMKRYRAELFLACKTLMRTKRNAYSELHRSLKRLHTDYLNLYQLHSVDELSELETVLGPGGAMEAILEAKAQGILQFIGITSHRLDLIIRALELFDFDTIMFPFNFIFYADRGYRTRFEKLMKIVQKRDIGVMVIKSIAKGNWEEKYQSLPILRRPYTTWYEPFETGDTICRAVNFVLSQKISTLVSASDAKLLSLMIDAAECFSQIAKEEQNMLLTEGKKHTLLEFTF
jgi:aryl-alcohol dehydrogenase-like predicted oxidoreductase